MSDAHREMYLGEQALDKADTAKAIQLLWDGLTKYEKILNEYPELKIEDETKDEALLSLMAWHRALELEEREVPDNYPLKTMWDSNIERREHVTTEFNRRRRGLR
jgi:hypothetical protein